jgi:hypothetical protein
MLKYKGKTDWLALGALAVGFTIFFGIILAAQYPPTEQQCDKGQSAEGKPRILPSQVSVADFNAKNEQTEGCNVSGMSAPRFGI